MKKFLALLLVFVLCFSLVACSSSNDEPENEEGNGEVQSSGNAEWDAIVAAAKEEGTVTVYSNFPKDTEIEVFKEFTKEYGIEVNYVKIGGSVPTMQKYMEEAAGGQQEVDLIQMSSLTAQQVIDAGYTKEFPSYMPNLVNLGADFQGTANFKPTVLETLVLVYNTTMISADELPNSYEELADPKYKSQFIIGSPENSTNTLKLIQGAKELYGEDWLAKFGANDVMVVDKEVTAAELVANGERPFAFMCETAPATALANGAPLATKFMTDCTIVGQNGIILPHNPPHPNAGLLLADWMLGKTHQSVFAEKMNGYMTTTVAALPEGFPELADLHPYYPNEDEITNNSQALMDEWNKAIGTK